MTGAHHTIKGSFPDINGVLGLDLIDKTTVLQAANIMSGALAVVGVDNGLLHLAGCSKVPIVAGFTTVSPDIRLPYRDGVLGKDCYVVTPPATLACRFCQQGTNFLYGHDYRNCLYKNDSALDRLCTKSITADRFIHHLEIILGDKNV